MSKRHEAIGLKQTIRLEWMQQTTNLMLAGVDSKIIRQELHDLLNDKTGSGNKQERGSTSRSQAVNILMNVWPQPDPDVSAFRTASLTFLREHPSLALPVHWGMISSAYPFWFNVARQTGRLLALQDQVTQAQIINRLKEKYGDRQTVSRYARSVIRSFVAWGVLKDSNTKGCYERTEPLNIENQNMCSLLFESALLANPEAKSALGLLQTHPAFFPFQLPLIPGDLIAQKNNRIELVRYGLDDELLKLKVPSRQL